MTTNTYSERLALEVQKLIGEKLGSSTPNELIDGLAIACDDVAYRLGLSSDDLLQKISKSIETTKNAQSKPNPLGFLEKLKEELSTQFDANIVIECDPNNTEMYNDIILGIRAKIMVALDKNSNNDSYVYFVTFNDCYDVKKFEVLSGSAIGKDCRFDLHKDATMNVLEVVEIFFKNAHENIRKLRYEDCEYILF